MMAADAWGECGEDGAGNDGTCCHIQAHRAIAAAESKGGSA